MIDVSVARTSAGRHDISLALCDRSHWWPGFLLELQSRDSVDLRVIGEAAVEGKIKAN
jgi:hypothetical protein